MLSLLISIMVEIYERRRTGVNNIIPSRATTSTNLSSGPCDRLYAVSEERLEISMLQSIRVPQPGDDLSTMLVVEEDGLFAI
jgi:hypothetical protein